MVRTMCSRILKFPKPYFWCTRQGSCRFFSSPPQSHNIMPKMRIISSLRSRQLYFHALMSNPKSVTVETFDAFCEQGKVREATHVVHVLEDKGYVVDLQRLVGLAKLCGEAEALEEARVVHDCITAYHSTALDGRVCHSMIEMYSGCGHVDDALNVFEGMNERSSETWCIMIKCLAKNGRGELAIDMFSRFKTQGNRPDKEIFKAVFSACASLGDIHEGLLHFESMYREYGIIPCMEVYVSVTEMLAACGHLDEALEFVEKMKVEPSVEVWETMMNLCWVHGDIELGDRFGELVKKLDATRMNKESNAGLVAPKASDLAKEYLKEMTRQWRKRRMHEFKAGDTSHPESDRIFHVVRSLKMHMLEMGFVPRTQQCHEMDNEEKEEYLLSRSNTLAFACSTLNSIARSTVTVVSNIRTCQDGHNTMKMISLITGRELIQRDSKRFHHYKNGVCSCRDYW